MAITNRAEDKQRIERAWHLVTSFAGNDDEIAKLEQAQNTDAVRRRFVNWSKIALTGADAFIDVVNGRA